MNTVLFVNATIGFSETFSSLLIMNLHLKTIYKPIMNRGVTIHDATIRYISRYKPQDMS